MTDRDLVQRGLADLATRSHATTEQGIVERLVDCDWRPAPDGDVIKQAARLVADDATVERVARAIAGAETDTPWESFSDGARHHYLGEPVPTVDAALCVELGRRAVPAMMTEADWHAMLERFTLWPDHAIALATVDGEPDA